MDNNIKSVLPPLPPMSYFLENSTFDMQRDAIRGYAIAYAEAAVLSANAGKVDAVQIADAARLHLANMYQLRVDLGTSQMNGNMDWARLEGAVAVVQALRYAASQESPTQQAIDAGKV